LKLSSDLIYQFAKITSPDTPKKTESTVFGTVVDYGDKLYVRIDGSDQLTPVNTTTTGLKAGDRVTVMIKDHSATVTGNTTSPSTSKDDLDNAKEEIGNKITEVEILIADKVSTKEFDAEKARIDDLVAQNVTITGDLDAVNAKIENLESENVTITGDLTAVNAEIENLKVTKLDVDIADIKYATIENLEATNAEIHNLVADYGDFKVLTTDKFTAIDASIKNLDAEKISVDEAELKYANIDFANIGKAAIETFFAKSGMIGDLVVGDGTITGTLVGVTIKGDLIEGGTVKADKLVVQGEDGLYYKLNVSAETVSAEQTDYNSLNGSIITAKSITAEKVNVDDLVAFGATIGGFKITENSIYSGVKETVDNTTRGVYLDDSGQFSIGDSENYLTFFRDEDGTYKLQISASSLLFGTTNKKNVEDLNTDVENAQNAADAAQTTADSNEARLTVSESTIEQLSNSISMLITDENGSSMMTQTSDGWTFNISDIEKTIDNTANELNNLSGSVDEIGNTITNLNDLVNDISEKTAYIIMTTDEEGNPCIELGKEDNDFKVRITNTSVDFLEGSSKIAYVNNRSLYIERSIIKDELQIGEGTGFIWKRRTNGNMGLRWIGGAV
jgi:hypothetical protein